MVLVLRIRAFHSTNKGDGWSLALCQVNDVLVVAPVFPGRSKGI